MHSLESLLTNFSLHDPEYRLPDRKSGWAKGPKVGERYGASYVERFRAELQGWFNEGRLDKGKKISSAIMVERLKAKYPARLDLPTEDGVKKFISSAFQRQQTEERCGVEGRARPRRSGVGKIYTDMLVGVLDDPTKWAWKPARVVQHIYDCLHEQNPSEDLPVDFPSAKQLKSKLAALRKKRLEGDSD